MQNVCVYVYTKKMTLGEAVHVSACFLTWEMGCKWWTQVAVVKMRWIYIKHSVPRPRSVNTNATWDTAIIVTVQQGIRKGAMGRSGFKRRPSRWLGGWQGGRARWAASSGTDRPTPMAQAAGTVRAAPRPGCAENTRNPQMPDWTQGWCFSHHYLGSETHT